MYLFFQNSILFQIYYEKNIYNEKNCIPSIEKESLINDTFITQTITKNKPKKNIPNLTVISMNNS